MVVVVAMVEVMKVKEEGVGLIGQERGMRSTTRETKRRERKLKVYI